MTLRDELLQEIENRLSSTLISSYKSKAKACDTFEAFVFSIIVQAAVEEGAKTPIRWEDTRGITTNIVFRRSPGYKL